MNQLNSYSSKIHQMLADMCQHVAENPHDAKQIYDELKVITESVADALTAVRPLVEPEVRKK